MRVVSLGSGSSGNALLVEAGPQGRTRLLVDAGLSWRLIVRLLQQVDVAPTQIQGILLTHEHSDHVLGIPGLMKHYSIPIIADERTCKAVEAGLVSGIWRTDMGRQVSSTNDLNSPVTGGTSFQPGELEHILQADKEKAKPAQRTILLARGSRRMIGDIEVISFPTSHDAVAPCGYLLSAGGCRVCLVTDTGEVTPAMLEVMVQADLLIIESNHDRQRLLRGPYPQRLKQRILSDTGHLSNDQAADAILRTWRSDSIRWIWLSHLSRTNNTPSLALKGVRTRLQEAQANLAQVHISTLPPTMGSVWDSTQLWSMPRLWSMER